MAAKKYVLIDYSSLYKKDDVLFAFHMAQRAALDVVADFMGASRLSNSEKSGYLKLNPEDLTFTKSSVEKRARTKEVLDIMKMKGGDVSKSHGALQNARTSLYGHSDMPTGLQYYFAHLVNWRSDFFRDGKRPSFKNVFIRPEKNPFYTYEAYKRMTSSYTPHPSFMGPRTRNGFNLDRVYSADEFPTWMKPDRTLLVSSDRDLIKVARRNGFATFQAEDPNDPSVETDWADAVSFTQRFLGIKDRKSTGRFRGSALPGFRPGY